MDNNSDTPDFGRKGHWTDAEKRAAEKNKQQAERQAQEKEQQDRENAEREQAEKERLSAARKARFQENLSGFIHGVSQLPARMLGMDTKAKVGVGAAAVAAVGIPLTMHFLDPETHLRNRDPNYLEKCFSYNAEASMKAPMAQKRADKILSIVDEFGSKGQNTVEKLKSDDAIFCYGMDNTPAKDHWSVTNVYLSPSEEPDSLSALFYAKADFESFWSRAVRKPSGLNEYTPESGLIFSRAARATYAVEKIKNAYRAIKKAGDYQNIMTSAPWVTFFNENPTYKNVIPTYIETMQGKGDENLAMREAMQSLMQDQNFLQDGDIKYLNGYLYHVENQDVSSSEYIYSKGFGFGDYAFVDIDRDGFEDDVIRLSAFGNSMVEYTLDENKWGYTRQEETYACTRTDADGNVIVETCTEDVYERVYYTQIPAIETATMTLNPETLKLLAGKTDTNFLSDSNAARVVSEVVGNGLLYAQPHSNEVRELISKINTAHRDNFSGRQISVMTAKPTFGLN